MALALTRRVIPLALMVTAIAAALVVLLLARTGSPSFSAREQAVASQLRCPTCQELSVAQSDSQTAMSMRAVIRAQLRAGRTPEQIRSWFAARYGQQVLLDPRQDGAGAVLWAVPATVALAGVVSSVFLYRRRRATGADLRPSAPRSLAPARLALVTALVLGAGVIVTVLSRQTAAPDATDSTAAGRPMTAASWVAVGESLEQQGSYASAAEAYRRAYDQQPENAALRTRLAFVLIRADRPASAAALVQPLTIGGGVSQRAEALLVLGLSQYARHLSSASTTLHTFLRLQPSNPAAPQIRQLLRKRP